MASLGKLTNTFLQANQETTLALANLNFNFALFKYEAPSEYHPLGNSLSTRRKEAAEDGSIHLVARKLTALFRTAIPNVPNLIQAYGVRASEIATLPQVNPRGSYKQGVFADHVGADGTSIWASATSGKGAVTMHLLACMLARIWNREQAIPIWAEFVQHRRAHLESGFSKSEGFLNAADLTASRIELSRTELDEWDASARSWLQTADRGQKLRQTQLRLIIDNISLPVSSDQNVYSSIMDAWVSAMQGLESLISGCPQRISNGAVLLGLSAWHLYPDIVLAGTNQYVKQSDLLIRKGGVITVGLENKTEDGKGAFWSLPLTQARYYGEPVVSSRHVGVGQSQVSFDEFILTVIGSILNSWKQPGLDLKDSLEAVMAATRANDSLPLFPSDQEQFLLSCSSDEETSWSSMLRAALARYHQAVGIEHQQMTRLIKFGQRNCSKLLSSSRNYPPPVFGFTNFLFLMEAHGSNSVGRIALLQAWARIAFDSRVVANAVIRFRTNQSGNFQYANIPTDDDYSPKRQKLNDDSAQRWDRIASFGWHAHDPSDDTNLPNPAFISKEIYVPPGPGTLKGGPYTYVCGHPGLAAIYIRADAKETMSVSDNCMSVPHLLQLMKSGFLDSIDLLGIIDLDKKGGYLQSLQAIFTASRIYKKLPGAQVNLQVTSKPAHQMEWWKNWNSSRPDGLPAVMSCIALFETGTLNIAPGDLGQHCFAVCHGSSIFVASSLLADPGATGLVLSMERIIGNVGKPGLTFLVTPPDPKIKRLDPASWNLIAHEKFDGKTQDNFQGTSFHLSFTGYELPLAVGQRSVRDVPAYLLETAVSIYEKGEWIADLDILEASKSWNISIPKDCTHGPDAGLSKVRNQGLVAIDTWLELLDPPQLGQDAVIRAHRNPAARLALAALAVKKKRDVVILPETVCWECQLDIYPAAVFILPDEDVEEHIQTEQRGSEEDDDGSSSGTPEPSSPRSLNTNACFFVW